MHIRLATINDLPEIVAIYNATIPGRLATADTKAVTVESKMDWFYKHQPNRRPLWVIQVSDEIAGWVSLNDFYGRPAYDGTAEISIYIKDHFQKKGYAQKGLEYAVNNCKSLKIHSLLAFVFEHNIPSIRFFKKNKFKQMGLLEDIAIMDDSKFSLVLFGLKIDF